MEIGFDFIGPINDANILSLRNLIAEQTEPIEHLTINISSAGGSVSSGITIYNYLKALPYEITTHNLGEVSSAAIPLYLAGQTRTSAEIAKFVIHSLQVELNGNYVYHQVDEHLRNLDRDIRNYAGIINRETNGLNGKIAVDSCLRGGSLILDTIEASECGIVTQMFV